MAPEVLSGERATLSSDLFSLAALYYWLFSFLPIPVPRSITRELAAACSHRPSNRPDPDVLLNKLQKYKSKADELHSISEPKDEFEVNKNRCKKRKTQKITSKKHSLPSTHKKRENSSERHFSPHEILLDQPSQPNLYVSSSYTSSSSSSVYALQ